MFNFLAFQVTFCFDLDFFVCFPLPVKSIDCEEKRQDLAIHRTLSDQDAHLIQYKLPSKVPTCAFFMTVFLDFFCSYFLLAEM